MTSFNLRDAIKRPGTVGVMMGLVWGGSPAVGAEVADTEESAGHARRVLHLATEHDVTLGAGLTMVGQKMDGTTNDSGLTYSVDIALRGDFEDKGIAFIYINTAQGEGVDTGAATGPNADNETGDLAAGGYSEMRIAEAWYQYPINKIVSLTVGKIDPTGIYDGNEVANDETSQFLADAFVNNPAIAFPGYSGGLNLGAAFSDTVAVNVGVFENTSDFAGTLDTTFIIGEVDLEREVGEREGHLRLIAWSEDTTDNSGFALSADQDLTDTVTAMFRYGSQDDTQAFDTATSIGAQWAIGKNRVGLAYSLLAATASGSDDESQTELYYKHAIAEHIHITADVQFIANPNFNSDAENIVVYGVRGQIEL